MKEIAIYIIQTPVRVAGVLLKVAKYALMAAAAIAVVPILLIIAVILLIRSWL
jgi:hypothetical protein